MASSLASQLGQMTLAGPARPGGTGGGLQPIPRPGYGRAGKAAKVRVNAFQINPPDLTCYHYDVKIHPLDPKRPARLNRQIWTQLAALPSNPFGGLPVCYDGKANAWSPRALPAPQGSFTLNLAETDGSVSRGNQFKVVISLIRPVQLGALRAFISGGTAGANVDEGAVMSAIQALNVLVTFGPMQVNPSRGASFFLREGQGSGGAAGIEQWRGYFSSVRPGIGCAFLNLDITSAPFFKPGNLADVMLELARMDTMRLTIQDLGRMPPYVAIKLGRMLKGVRITRTFPDADNRPVKRKIRALVATSASKSTFQLANGTTTNVAEYFLREYGVRLRYPELPCILVSKTALFPIEVCSIDLGQKYSKKMSAQQTTEVLKFTTVKPRERRAKIERAVEHIFPRNDTSMSSAWGLSISREPMELTARVLPAPSVVYSNGPVLPNEGSWTLLGKKFVAPAKLDRWIVLIFDSPQNFPLENAKRAVTSFMNEMRLKGMLVSPTAPQIIYAPDKIHPSKVGLFIKTTAGPINPQLLVCFLTAANLPYYAAIKLLGDVTVGVASQCLVIPKAMKGGPQYFANVAMKVNVKLGGVNSTAVLGPAIDKPTVIFGIDVTHSAPGSYAPSVAAVVASMNKTFTNYGSRISPQLNRQEVVQNLAQLVHELLLQFKATMNVKPERLIFFRDGVSEGQFAHVLGYEVEAVREACRRIDPTFRPKTTFIICGKRHHISIFPDPNDRNVKEVKTDNAKAGTIIDRGITSPFTFDWYLQSHGSLLGTSRSAHYTVLVDESRFDVDALQQLCYSICYTFPRCSRSVSYATPAYLADRLATRGALLLGTDAMDDSVSVASGQTEQTALQLLAQARGRVAQIHRTQAARLFFM